MQEVKTDLESRYTPKEDAKLRLLTIDDLDGRTTAVKYVKELESQITVDLGGDLTAAQTSILKRAVVFCAILADQEARWISGEPIPLTEYCSATNVLNRLLTTLGIERRQRPVSGVPVLLG